ncbi:hypothetical protein RHGRI_029296 [Rhododendron griersonianum]|uniref:Uncharacterized protein n=1 Tax=Rhododendron griersonianum TaxID=479676 RepID=A0AAV6IJ78_9ERIC|nr:hypothetical protein RHGRI_029296 [Rhododendron griersonianum]
MLISIAHIHPKRKQSIPFWSSKFSKNPSRYKPKPVGEPNPIRRPIFGIPAPSNGECIPPSFPNGVFTEKLRNAKNQSSRTWLKNPVEKKVTKSTWPDFGFADIHRVFLVELFHVHVHVGVTPSNVEGGARLKRREVDLDDALVEDTPPLKIKGTRPQENHDVEGSLKVRSRFGSVAHGIKGKHHRLDVQESAQKRTRSVNVARGIKAKHPRSRKHRDVNEREIRETVYRASLNGIKTLIDELNLSEEHKNVLI